MFTWNRSRGWGARGRFDPIIRTMLRYCPQYVLSHTGTNCNNSIHKDVQLKSCTYNHTVNQLVKLCFLFWSYMQTKLIFTLPYQVALQSIPGHISAGQRCPPAKTLTVFLCASTLDFCWQMSQQHTAPNFSTWPEGSNQLHSIQFCSKSAV